MNTSEVLNRAADLIEERGWSTGVGWSVTGADHALCVEGAIAAAMNERGGPGYRCPAYHAVSEYVGGKALFMWDDHLPFQQDESGFPSFRGWLGGGTRDEAHELAREQVIATLRAAAVIEAAKENAETREQVTA